MTGFKNLFSFGHHSSEQAHDDQFNYSATLVQTKWTEDQQNYYFKVALPGLTDKDILIKLDDSNGDTSNPLLIIQAGLDIQRRVRDVETNQSQRSYQSEHNQQDNQTNWSSVSGLSQGSDYRQFQHQLRSSISTPVESGYLDLQQTRTVPNLDFNLRSVTTSPSSSNSNHSTDLIKGIFHIHSNNSNNSNQSLANLKSVFNVYRNVFPVPTSRVKTDSILASVENGVLTIKFPKVHQGFGVHGTRPVQLTKSSRL